MQTIIIVVIAVSVMAVIFGFVYYFVFNYVDYHFDNFFINKIKYPDGTKVFDYYQPSSTPSSTPPISRSK